MYIGQLAKMCDVGKDTIRHYERLGLIYSSEHQAGSRIYRVYDDSCVHIIKDIKRAQTLGFRLSELKLYVQNDATNKSNEQEVLYLLHQKLIELEEKRDQIDMLMQSIKDKIESLE